MDIMDGYQIVCEAISARHIYNTAYNTANQFIYDKNTIGTTKAIVNAAPKKLKTKIKKISIIPVKHIMRKSVKNRRNSLSLFKKDQRWFNLYKRHRIAERLANRGDPKAKELVKQLEKRMENREKILFKIWYKIEK